MYFSDMRIPGINHILYGFTLIELIVVIAILAIFALIAIPRFAGRARTCSHFRNADTKVI